MSIRSASQTGNAATVAELEKQLDSIQTEMTNLQKNFVKNQPCFLCVSFNSGKS